MKAQKLLIRLLKRELSNQGVAVKNFTDEDWEIIAYEWISNSADFIEETIGNDMLENDKLYKLAKKRKALSWLDDEED